MNEFIPSDFQPDLKKEPEGFKNFEDPFDMSNKIIPESKKKTFNLSWLYYAIAIILIITPFSFYIINKKFIKQTKIYQNLFSEK